jgi:hypothetical protein
MHLVEIRSAVGPISFGPFSTLEEARDWASGYGIIVPVFQPALPADKVVHATAAELGEFLKVL